MSEHTVGLTAAVVWVCCACNPCASNPHNSWKSSPEWVLPTELQASDLGRLLNIIQIFISFLYSVHVTCNLVLCKICRFLAHKKFTQTHVKMENEKNKNKMHRHTHTHTNECFLFLFVLQGYMVYLLFVNYASNSCFNNCFVVDVLCEINPPLQWY